MSERPPFVWTKYATRAYHAFQDLATDKVGFLLLIADYGMGKTFFLEQVVQRLQWRFPPQHYVNLIQTMRTTNAISSFVRVSDLMDFVEEIGLLPDALATEAEEYLTPIHRALERNMERMRGAQVLTFIDWLVHRTKQSRPDPLKMLRMYGIDEQPQARCPVFITGQGSDRPASIIAKLLRGLDPMGFLASRAFKGIHLMDLLREMPAFILIDEADRLSVDCLHELRQVCEGTRTPFCLAGTQELLFRLESSRALRALATRAEAQVDLGRPTVTDLRTACPDIPSELVLDIWKASAKNFRVAVLIVRNLRAMRECFPDRPLTKSAVRAAADLVFAARTERLDLPVEAEEAETDARPARRAAMRHPEPTRALAARAVRAAGSAR